MSLVEGLDVVFHPVVFNQSLDLGELYSNRGRIRVEGHHDPAEPFLAAQLPQAVAILALAEALVLVHRGGATQRTVEIVAPGMVRADDHLAVARALQERRHAVQADIGHGAEHTRLVAQHDERLAREFVSEIVTRL